MGSWGHLPGGSCTPPRLHTLPPKTPRPQTTSHLVAVVIDGLLAQQHQPRLLPRRHRRQQLGNGQRLHLALCLYVHRTVGTHGQGRAQRVGGLRV